MGKICFCYTIILFLLLDKKMRYCQSGRSPCLQSFFAYGQENKQSTNTNNHV